MIGWFSGVCRKITDFLPGSKIRTKFEAVGVEMEAQDFAFYTAARKAIPTAIYQAFDFTLQPPTKASGSVTFTADPAPVTDVVIPQGTRIATVKDATHPEKVYETTATVTLQAGDTTVEAPIACVSTGTAGNVASGNITVLKTSSLAGITAVTNAASLVNGKDRETEPERMLRFQDYIVGLRRGIADAIVAAAKTATVLDGSGIVTEQVRSAVTDEAYYPDNGHIACFIYNGDGNTSDDLATRAQQIIDGYVGSDGKKVAGYKAAGIVCDVLKATEAPQDVTVSIIPDDDSYDEATLQDAVEQVITTYLQGLDIGQECVRNELIERIMAVAGVYDCDLTVPAATVPAGPHEVITHQGNITVTVDA